MKKEPSKIHPKSRRSPIKEANFLSRFTFSWITECIKISSKVAWTQDMNYDLPEYDKVSTHKEKIIATFIKKRKIFSTILSVYFPEIVKLTIAVVCYKTIASFSSWMSGKASDTIANNKNLYHNKEEILQLCLQFGLYIVSNFLSQAIQNYYSFEAQRLSLAIRSTLFSVIQDKIMKFSPLNSRVIGQGFITNLIQVDSVKTQLIFYYFYYIIDSLTGLLVGLFFLMGSVNVFSALVFFSWFLLLCFFYAVVYYYYAKVTTGYLAAKDCRMRMFKNVLENMDYVKTSALESYFCLELFDRREYELSWLKLIAVVQGFKSLMDGIRAYGANLYFILLFISLSSYSKKLGSGKFFEFLSLTSNTLSNLAFMVWAINNFTSINVSLIRINKFLSAKEIDQSWLKKVKNRPTIQNESKLSRAAIRVVNGNFKWKYSQEEEVGDRESDEIFRRATGLEKKLNFSGKMLQVSLEGEDLLSNNINAASTSINEAEDENDVNQFYLRSINLEIKRGEKVAVIGQSNSGTSSLLYSLLGEMIPLGNTKVEIGGTLSFLSQTRWILGETLKENITMGKEFDDERMNDALRMAQMTEDLRTFPDGLDTILGDNGDTVSGGQKARIDLARCFYQE